MEDNSLIGACCPSQMDAGPSVTSSQGGGLSAAKGSKKTPQSIAPIDPGTLIDSKWHEKLQEKGVNIAASYYIELAGNPIGGKNHGFAHAASVGWALGLDFDKLLNIHGLSFFSSALYRSGSNLSANKIDNQFPVTQLFGGGTIRLNEVYLKETLFDGNFHFKVGHLTGGNDFLSSPFYCEFISNALCGSPISVFFNAPFLAYPFSTWGAYLDFKPSKTVLLKFAVYNNNLGIKANKYHGCNFTFKSTDGAMWMNEWVYLLNQSPNDQGFKGNYKLGGYYQTGQKKLFNGGYQTGNYGLYALFDQMLYRKFGPGTSQGLTLFGSFLFAPPNRNMFPYFFDLALVYKGLFAGRNSDYLSFGMANGNYSSDLRAVQRRAKVSGIPSPLGDQPQFYETVFELNYWYRFNKYFALTPGIQYVINPKGYGTTSNAVILDMQISIDLLGLPTLP
jgi:porin